MSAESETPQSSRSQLDYAGPIERLRRRRGMTREALAEASGVSPSYLSEVERGFKRPSTDVLAAIARALGMAPSELLAYVESSSPEPPPPAQPATPTAAAMPSPSARRSWLAGVHNLDFSIREDAGALKPKQSADIDALISAARDLDPADLRVLLDLARRLAAKRK
jgi:transcriptional regulator with XRE-family HTH domain